MKSVSLGIVLLLAGSALAHPGHEQAIGPVSNAAAEKLPEPQVTIKVENGRRIIESNGIPDHRTGEFPNRGNPNSIKAQEHRFTMPVEPKVNEKPTEMSLGMSFGVAINGIPMDPNTAEFWRRNRDWNYDAKSGKINLGLDQNNAHVQPTGAYHYHGVPTALINAIRQQQKKDKKIDMVLVGYAADGFPIYAVWGYQKADDVESRLVNLRSSYRLKKGNRPAGDIGPGGRYDETYFSDWAYVEGAGDLDECNGRTGVTPEYPDGTYYYVLTETYPFIPRQFRGTPDRSFRKGPGGRGPEGPGPGTRDRRTTHQ